jgi:hypothetical protein
MAEVEENIDKENLLKNSFESNGTDEIGRDYNSGNRSTNKFVNSIPKIIQTSTVLTAETANIVPTEDYTVYTYRWFVLFIFCLAAAINQTAWISL